MRPISGARLLLPGLTFLGLLLGACQTLPPDQVAASGTDQDFVQLGDTELDLLDLRLAPDPARLEQVRAELDRAARKAGANRLYQARVAGLQGQAALLSGDTAAARHFVDSAFRLSDAEEGAWLVRAALEPSPAKRLALLQQGLANSDRRSRLLCETGEELLRSGRAAEAAQDLDEGLRGLDGRYRALYGADRDRALSLAQAQRDAGSTPTASDAQSLDAPLTLQAMVERAFTSTRLLSEFSPQPSPVYDSVRSSLASAGLLLRPDAPPSSPCARKDAAFFLWGVVLHAERNPRLAGMYRQKFAASPVPDVPANAPWFEAVLGVVEREIMDLPDGVHFVPDGAVTGVDYLKMLARLSKLYR